jgi:hypothetical protein
MAWESVLATDNILGKNIFAAAVGLVFGHFYGEIKHKNEKINKKDLTKKKLFATGGLTVLIDTVQCGVSKLINGSYELLDVVMDDPGFAIGFYMGYKQDAGLEYAFEEEKAKLQKEKELFGIEEF